MKKRNANEEKLSNVVDSFINQFGLKKRFQEHEILQEFTKIMGPFLMKKVTNDYVTNQKLFLKFWQHCHNQYVYLVLLQALMNFEHVC